MMSFLSGFVIWYPICMSIIWMVGAIVFYICIESKQKLSRDETPFVSILIPCYNEEQTIRETIYHVMKQKYPHYEVIVINDGSIDQTVPIVKQLIGTYPNLRCVNVKKNLGKANALHAGLLASKGDFLVCIDADAILDVHALQYMIPHFSTANQGNNIGAVTGNPRVRNRNNLLSKIQISEFSSIIGMIKRTQSIYGGIMTVSGVVVAFRKQALLDCQLWDRDILTEDIAVTWKLQKKGWQIKYEPSAICWMLVPETLSGLWKQRIRWAQGGLEVLIKHRDIFLSWKHKSLYIIYIEQLISIIWSIVWFLMTVTFFINISFTFDYLKLFTVSSGVLSMICVFQFFIAIMIDKKYDVNLIKEYIWAAWYPICYWYINVFVIIMAIVKVSTKRKGKFAVWESPDRGLQQTK